MVEGGVDEEIGVGASAVGAIPSSRLDTDGITDAAELFELTIGDNHTIFAEKSNLGSIRTPYNILDLGSSEFTEDAATLHFKEDCTIISTEDNAARRTSIVEAVNIRNGGGNTLGCFIVHVLDNNLTLVTVQDGETV
jgi:hypothetical protein